MARSEGAKVAVQFYVLSGMYTLAASLIWGINTLFLLGAGLHVAEVFVANGAFAVGMMLFEIPTGAVADVRGRRFSFLLGVFTVFVSSAGYLAGYFFGFGLAYFVVFSLILGLGFTFYSGALEAWAVDQVIACGEENTLQRMFSTGGAITAAATLVGTLSGGLLADLNLSIPYLVRSGLLLVLLVWALVAMKEDSPAESFTGSWGAAIWRTTRDSIEYGWRRPELRRVMMISLVQGVVGMWAWYAWQPYFLDLFGDSQAYWVAGAVSVCTSLAMMAGSAVSSWLAERVRRPRWRFGIPLTLSILAAFFIGFFNAFWPSFVSLLGMMFSMGLYGPIKQTYMHGFIPSPKRATVISFDSMIANVGGSVGQPGLGYVSQDYGFSVAYMTAAAIMVPALLFLPRSRAPDS